MRFLRTKSECATCPLRDRTRVWGEGSDHAALVLLGEAPGREEDEKGRPFVGAAGRTLNWGFAQAGLHRDGLFLMNVLSCRPPNNAFDSDEGELAQVHCRHGFEEELECLRKSGMKVLVPLGANSCRAVGLIEPIGKVRGSVYERDGYVIIPTYHPAYLARMKYDKAGAPVDLSAVWIADLKKAKYIASHGWKPPREDFELYPTIERLREFVGYVCQQKSLIAVDIETTGFDPDRAEIVVVGLADSGEHAVSVPFLSQGGRAYWSNGDLAEAKDLLNRVFRECPLMFQNALFDVPFLRKKGFSLEYENVRHDTLLLHHAISPELPHNLGFIVSIYGSTPYWKGDFLSRTGTILEMDDKDLRVYNARDCVVLHQVLGPLVDDLDETGTRSVYEQESLALLPAVGSMHERGIKLDGHRLDRYRQTLREKIRTVEGTLRSCGLPSGFNLDSGDDLRYFLFGVEPAKFKKLEALQPREDPKSGKVKTLRTDTKKYKDLLALKEVRDNVHPLVALRSFRGRSTDSGKMSTDEQGLLSLQLHLQNRAEDIARLKQPTKEHALERDGIVSLLSWLAEFREYRRLGKLLSTYTHYPTRQDGRVHTRFSVSGTATGRLSSSEPNLQNIPKKDVEARSPFVAPTPGFIFLSADYTNLEVWVMAYESGDKLLLSQLRSGIKIHNANVKLLFGLEPDHPDFVLAKRAAKIFQFGKIQYGGSVNEIYEKVILDVPKLALTRARFLAAVAKWEGEHPGYTAWAARVKREVVETRRVRVPGGRIRIVYGAERDILKQALNTPIQGGAASIVNQATIRIHKRMKGMRSALVLQIHDEFLLEVALDELAAVKKIVREEMERPVLWWKEPVSFPTSQATGKSWAACYRQED